MKNNSQFFCCCEFITFESKNITLGKLDFFFIIVLFSSSRNKGTEKNNAFGFHNINSHNKTIRPDVTKNYNN